MVNNFARRQNFDAILFFKAFYEFKNVSIFYNWNILILEQSQKKAFRKDDILSSETTYDPISKQFKAKQQYTLGQNIKKCPKIASFYPTLLRKKVDFK